MRHELLCLFEHVIGVDQDFANIGLEVVANGADHQTAFLVNQESTLLRVGGAINGFPQLHQVIHVPLQFLGVAANGSGAGNQAHALRHLQLVHYVAQFGTLVTLDAARDTATTRVVGHQYQITAGQTDNGRQCCTLVAALVLVDLNDQFLAFAQGFLDRRTADIDAWLKIGARDFLEREKAVPVGTVIDKGRFEARLDACNDAFINVALFLFLGGRFNVEINQFLTINNGNTEFFSLCCIKKHAFHKSGLPRAFTGGAPCAGSDGLVVGGTLHGLSRTATNKNVSLILFFFKP